MLRKPLYTLPELPFDLLALVRGGVLAGGSQQPVHLGIHLFFRHDDPEAGSLEPDHLVLHELVECLEYLLADGELSAGEVGALLLDPQLPDHVGPVELDAIDRHDQVRRREYEPHDERADRHADYYQQGDAYGEERGPSSLGVPPLLGYGSPAVYSDPAAGASSCLVSHFLHSTPGSKSTDCGPACVWPADVRPGL